METIYYSINAKRLTVCGQAGGRRASGGGETVCYAFVSPHRKQAPAGSGKILDFDACRRSRAQAQPALPDAAEQRGPRNRGPRPWLLLDLCASAALVAVVAAVLIRFFTL